MSDLNIDNQDLVDTVIAARILNVSPRTLYNYRRQGKGPAYYRIGDKTIKYSIKDLNTFAERIEA